jgi:PAS domain S-box-containing protein
MEPKKGWEATPEPNGAQEGAADWLTETDPREWELETLLNAPVLQSLMEDYAKLTLTVTAILDLKGKVLVAVGWQDICTKFHRVNATSCQNCTESDLFLAGHVERGEYVAYKCKNGLWDVVTPLYVADRHMGNIYTGQFFYDDEVIDRQAFEAQAEAFGYDKTTYLAALDCVPRFSRDQVRRLMDFLVKFTDLVSRFTLSNIRSAEFIREQSRSALALRKSEAALRENRAMLAQILDTIPQSVFWKAPDGRYLGCNKPFSKAAGVEDPAEVIGKTDFDLPWTHEESEAYRADDRQVLESRQPKLRIIETQQQADGTRLQIETSKAPLLDGNGHPFAVLGIYEDITERKKAGELLKVKEEQLRLFVERTPTAIAMLDTEMTYLVVSNRWLVDYNLGSQTIIGRSHYDVFPEISQRWIDIHQRCLAGAIEKCDEDPFPRADGTTDWIRWEIQPWYRGAGDIGGIVIFSEIITQREVAEERNLELQAQLQQVQKMESLGTLAGGVAHDINNVLGAILGLASAHIGTQPYGSPLHQALDTICKATERGGKMVKSLLNFARQSPAENNKLDMNAILREQVALLERTTLAKVRLEIDLEANLRPILGDASALAHAFMNLCVNAVDAMSENGALTLHTRNVDNDWIEVVVEDNGTGMSKEVLGKAMEPFYTTKGIGKGTGLGLSMVFSTVKAHRGQMAIESEPGQGTRVMLRFPACEQETQAQAAVPAVSEETVPPHGSLKVLLVDDDDLIQSSVQAILECLGYTAVTIAPSGEEALAMLEGGLEPGLVILDMNMPGLGGMGTLPRLRVLRPELPVLLATGRVDQTSLTLASAHPGVTILSKPFGLRELQKHPKTLGWGKACFTGPVKPSGMATGPLLTTMLVLDPIHGSVGSRYGGNPNMLGRYFFAVPEAVTGSPGGLPWRRRSGHPAGTAVPAGRPCWPHRSGSGRSCCSR